ncbi:hypothetical protein J2W28_002479 [Variovorax boronicumulans]|uniref:hypothetical protein n=1 Tax=Variovorax boronicumulans TaxID=436515 RepID=UPI0027803182|nr:hypothetical protein [Variovorax boronicumulans]MDP9991304.1 hypothetical protein [Variovorax boronicumulans]MDQ0003332.1 hypothetical protein [Variovorax boronicumulans]
MPISQTVVTVLRIAALISCSAMAGTALVGSEISMRLDGKSAYARRTTAAARCMK